MLVWNYGDTTIVCAPLVTRLQLVPEMMAIGELPTVLCILRTTQIIRDIGKAENGHTGSYISIDLAQYAEMDGRDSSDDYSDLVGNYSYSYAHTRRVDGGYSGSLWLYSMFCLPNMGRSTMIRKSLTKRKIVISLSLMEILLFKGFRLDTSEPTEAPPPLWLMYCLFFCDCKTKVSTQVGTLNLDGNIFCLPLEDRFEKASLSLADNLERIRQKRLIRKLVVSKDAKCVALGSSNGEICVVEVKQMEHKLADLRNHISFQGVMNLLQEVSELAFAQFNRSVILLAGLQGIGNTTVVTTLQMKFLLSRVTLTCLGELRDARILFSSGFNETLQVNSELSSLRYSSAPILLMYARDINSVLHLNFQAWSFLLHLHERGPAKNRVFPQLTILYEGCTFVCFEAHIAATASYGVWSYLSCLETCYPCHKVGALEI